MVLAAQPNPLVAWGYEVSRAEQSAPGFAFLVVVLACAAVGKSRGIREAAGMGNYGACSAHALDRSCQ
jgi:hypothetical protein